MHQRHARERFRVHQRIACGEQRASGMAYNRRRVDAEIAQQRIGVGGELLEGILIMLRLNRGAEADLARRDDPIADLGERSDGFFPGCRAKILGVEKDDCTAVGGARRRNVHLGHQQFLALRVEGEAPMG